MTTLVASDDPIWSANAGADPDLVPAHLVQKPSVGVLFVTAAWLLAAAAGMLAGYLASRTVGLPPSDHEEWDDDPDGVACLLLEAAFLAAVAARATSSP